MKPITSEDEYFARQELERKRRWAEEREAQLITERGERERVMKCPKCGAQLEEIAFGGVRIDKCFGCEGIWLDKGEPLASVGRASVVREGRDLTVVATMLMVERALGAAQRLESEGISLEVIDLQWVRPLDVATVAASVRRTGRVMVAEEQVHAGGWGASLISELAMAGVPLRSPPRAVSLPGDICISYSPPLEDAILPSIERIAEVARTAGGKILSIPIENKAVRFRNSASKDGRWFRCGTAALGCELNCVSG